MKKSPKFEYFLAVLCTLVVWCTPVHVHAYSCLYNAAPDSPTNTGDCTTSLHSGTKFSSSSINSNILNMDDPNCVKRCSVNDIEYTEGGAGHITLGTGIVYNSGAYSTDAFYCIVSDPNELHQGFTKIEDGNNHLVFALDTDPNGAERELFSYTVSNLVIGTDLKVAFNVYKLDENTPANTRAQLVVRATGTSTLDPTFIGSDAIGVGFNTQNPQTATFRNVQTGDVTITIYARFLNTDVALAFSDFKVYGCQSPTLTSANGESLFYVGEEISLVTDGFDSLQEIEWYQGTTSDINSATRIQGSGTTNTVVAVENVQYYFAKQGNLVASFLANGQVLCDSNSSTNLLYKNDFGTTTGRASDPLVDVTGNYTFQPTGKVDDEFYCIVSNINQADPWECDWPQNKTDHTGNENGAFLVVNAGTVQALFYEIDLGNSFCADVNYTLSLWAANVARSPNAPGQFRFEVGTKDASGNFTVINSAITGDIQGMADDYNPYYWNRFSFSFKPTANTNTFLRLYTTSAATQGNDIAIDDIMVTTCSPSVKLFTDAASESISIDDAECGKDITLSTVAVGDLSSVFSNAYYVWQMSEDENSWSTVAEGANLSTFTYTPSEGVKKFFRAVVANNAATAQKFVAGDVMDPCDIYVVTNTASVTDDCTPCPTMTAPVPGQTEYAYCAGDAFPSISVDFVKDSNGDGTEDTVLEWYEDEQRNTLISDNPSYSPNVPGEYYVFAVYRDNQNECYSNPAKITVIQNAVPTVTINPYGNVTNLECGLDELDIDVTANGNGTLDYLWNDMVTTADRVVTVVGDYTLTVTDANGCRNTASVSITENNDVPSAPQVAQSVYAYCADATVPTMYATAAGNDTNIEQYYVEWYEDVNRTSASVNTGLTYTYDQLKDGESKTFYLFTRRVKTLGTGGEYTDVECYSTGYATITLKANEQPTVTAAAFDDVVKFECGLDELTLNASATAAGTTNDGITANSIRSYAWTRTEVNADGTDGATSSVGTNSATLAVTQSGKYTVTVTDANGCSNTSSPIAIEDDTNVPDVLQPTADQTVYAYCSGSTIPTMTAKPQETDAANETYSIAWYSAPLDPADPSANRLSQNNSYTPATALGAGNTATYYVYTVRNKTVGTAGEYKDVICYSQATEITLKENQLPTVTVSVPNGMNTLQCGLSDITITAVGTAYGTLASDATVANSISSYEWRLGTSTNVIGDTDSYSATSAGTYEVTVIDANGCEASAQQVILQSNDAPDAPVAAQSLYAYCAGSQFPEMSASITAVSNATETYTIEWYDSADRSATILSNSSTYTYNGADLGQGNSKDFYVFTRKETQVSGGSSIVCYSAATTVTLSEYVNPNASISARAGVTAFQCGLNELSLNATATASTDINNANDIATYAWSLTANGTTTALTGTGATLAVTQSGDYTVTVTDANGCSFTSAPITISDADPADVVTVPAADQTLYAYCAGTTNYPAMSVTAPTSANGETYSIEWYDNDSRTGTALTATVVGNVSTYTYDGAALGAGQSKTFYAFTRRVQSVGEADNNPYTNIVCYSQATEITLTQNALPTVTIEARGGVTELECGLDELTLTATATASTAVNANNAITAYAWSDDTSITTATRTVDAAGTYTVTVTDANGCQNSDDIVITENTNVPSAPVKVDDYAYCSGSAFPTMEVTGITINDPQITDLKYEWYEDIARQNKLGEGTTYTYSGTALGAGQSKNFYVFTHTVKSVGANNEYTGIECYSTDYVTVTLTENALPEFDITVAEGTTDFLCGRASLTLQGPAAPQGTTYSYAWADDSNNSLGTNQTLTVTDEGTYYLTVTNTATGCEATKNITLTDKRNQIPDAPDAKQSDYPYCAGSALPMLELDETAQAGVTYEWYDGNDRTTAGQLGNGLTLQATQANDTYYVFARHEVGGLVCYSNATEITITENALPTVSIVALGNVTELECGLDELTLTATATAVAPANILAYEWTGGAVGEEFTATVAGTYTVTAIDNHGCEASASIDITENATIPAAPHALSNIYAYCTGEDLPTLEVEPVTSSQNIVTSLVWYADANRQTTMLAEGETYNVAEALGAGVSDSYYVFVHQTKTLGTGGEYTASCYSAATEIVLTENELPEFMITVEEGTAVFNCGTETLTLLGPDAPRGVDYNYQWMSAGESVGTAQNFVASEEGTYSLTVTNASTGCSASNDFRLLDRREHCDDPEPEPIPEVEPEEEERHDIIIPIYFTPNGDGLTDTWDIINIEYFPDAKIEIYDRFSRLLRRYTGADSGWDGTYNNHPMPSADYWYVVKHPELGTRSGHFILKR